MPNRVLFHKQTTGPFGRGFDSWYLITKDDGTFAVDHEWSHPAVSPEVDDDAGTTSVSAGHFFAKVEDQELLGKLRRAITRIINEESLFQIFAQKFAQQPSAPKFEPLATVIHWLRHCRKRDIDGLMTFYDAKATLDCACTGQKLCNGKDELRAYWEKWLSDPSCARVGVARAAIWAANATAAKISFLHFLQKVARA